MRNTRSSLVLGSAVSLTALLLVCGAIGPARGEDSETEVSGVVTAVGGSALPNTITVQTASGAVAVTCTTDTQIEVDDHETAVTDLATLMGLFAKVEYNAATGVATEVEVENEFEIFGQVVKVDGTTFPYSVAIQPFNGPPMTLTVTAATELETEDDAPVADLSALVGRFVQAEYDSRTGVAAEIELDTDNRFVTGVVASTDLVNGLLVVKTKAGDVTFAVDGETDVDLNFQEADVADLALGQLVMVHFEVDESGKNVAEEIDAVTPRPEAASGIITGVSTSGHVVTVRSEGLHGAKPTASVASDSARPTPTLLKVNAGTLVLLEGRRVSLDDLPPGCRFQTKYVTQNGLPVARKLICKLPPTVPISGVITAVTLTPPQVTALRRGDVVSASSVGTLDLLHRNGKTYPVAIYPDTQIKINGKVASPAELQALVAQAQSDGGQVRGQLLTIPFLAGQNPDGTDSFTYHCFRLHAKKVSSPSGTGG